MSRKFNILLSLSRAVNGANDKKKQKVFVKAWLYAALDIPDTYCYIGAGLFILLKEIEFDRGGLTTLINQCEKKFTYITSEDASKMANYYRSIIN